MSVQTIQSYDGELVSTSCLGCNPLSGDDPLPGCSWCGNEACITVPCTGWVSTNGAEHGVSWCVLHWAVLQALREPQAEPLPAIALNLVGHRLLLYPEVVARVLAQAAPSDVKQLLKEREELAARRAAAVARKAEIAARRAARQAAKAEKAAAKMARAAERQQRSAKTAPAPQQLNLFADGTPAADTAASPQPRTSKTPRTRRAA